MVAISAAILIAAPASAANRHVALPHQQHAKVTVAQTKSQRPSTTDAQRTETAQPTAQPNRGLIVGVGPLVKYRLPEFRDLAMAPTG